jgi:two-component system nitrogen regulation response regulator NtrX
MAGATLDDARHEFERRFLLARLEENGWNVSRTAEAIGLARESLSRKMRSYKLRAARE